MDNDSVLRDHAESIAEQRRKIQRLETLEAKLTSASITDATALATADKIVLRDGSAGFAAAAITATTLTASGKITTNASGGGLNAGIQASAVIPGINLNVTGGATDEKNWDIVSIASLPSILFRLINDASNAATTFFAVVRSTMTATSMALTATAIGLNGVVTMTAPVWTTPTLGNSWVAFGAPYSTAQYCIDAQGFVHLRGVIKSGTLATTIFTLPAGFRPTAQLLIDVQSNLAIATLQVFTNGAVQLTVGSNASLGLDNIAFPTN